MVEVGRRKNFLRDELSDVPIERTPSPDPAIDYQLERILCEDDFVQDEEDPETGESREVQVKLYLIKWEGWPIHEASWVNRDAFEGGREETLHEWQTQSMREARAKVEPFDRDRWDIERQIFFAAKNMRYKKVREKRRRMGLEINSSGSESEGPSRDRVDSAVDEEIDQPEGEDEHQLSEHSDFDPNAPSASSSSSSEAEESDDDVPLAQTTSKRAYPKTNDAYPRDSDKKGKDSHPPPKRRKTVKSVSVERKAKRDKLASKKKKGQVKHLPRRTRESSSDDSGVDESPVLGQRRARREPKGSQRPDSPSASDGSNQDLDDSGFAADAVAGSVIRGGLFKGTAHSLMVLPHREAPMATMSGSRQEPVVSRPNAAKVHYNGPSDENTAVLGSTSAHLSPHYDTAGSRASQQNPSQPSAKNKAPSTVATTQLSASRKPPQALTMAGRPGFAGFGPTSQLKKLNAPSYNVFDPTKSKTKVPRKPSTANAHLPAPTLQMKNNIRKSHRQDLIRPPPPGAQALGSVYRPETSGANNSPPPENEARPPPNPYTERGMERKLGRHTPPRSFRSDDVADLNSPNTTLSSAVHRLAVSSSTLDDSTDLTNDHPPLTCWYWDTDKFCKFERTGRCPFEHRYLDPVRVAVVENTMRKDQATCFFWWTNGGCKKSNADCNFSHARKGYLASDPSVGTFTRLSPSEPRPKPPPRDEVVNERRPEMNLALPRPRPHENEWLGCFYYNFDEKGCNKPAWKCSFLHAKTRFVAGKSSKTVKAQEIYQEDGEIFWRSHSDPEKVTTRTSRAAHHPSRSSLATNGERILDDRETYDQTQADDPSHADDRPMRIGQRLQVLSLGSFDDPDGNTTNVEVWIELLNPVGFPQSYDLKRAIEELSCLDIQSVCYLDDAKTWLDIKEGHPRSAEANIIARERADPATNAVLSAMADTLGDSSAAAIVCLDKFLIIIYPNTLHDRSWREFLKDTSKPLPGSVLCCHIIALHSQSPLRNMIHRGPVAKQETFDDTPAKQMEKSRSQLLIETHRAKIGKAVLLIIHQRYQDEMNEIIHALQQQDIKVYLSKDYRYFQNQAMFRRDHDSADATMLFHPTYTRFDGFSGFADLICNKFRTIKVYQLPDLSQESNAPLELSQLFPDGQAVFLMDDLFLEYPHDLVDSIIHLIARTKSPRTTHIVTRPGLTTWLVKLQQNATPGDNIYDKLIGLLEKVGLFEDPGPIEPGQAPPRGLYSPNASDYPEYMKLSDTDEKGAAEYLAEWYAGWSLSNITHCRRFALLSMTSSRKRTEWSTKYQHIQVMTPHQWLVQEEERKRWDAKLRQRSNA